MDNRVNLRSMLNNLINDKHEEASLDLHNYLTAKMRGVAGIATTDTVDDSDSAGVIAGDDVNDDDNQS